jgi:SAM-dependent methyltransferase
MASMKEKQSRPRPIFIHAIWRTGSTYIWKKFREQGRYRSYYEPLHEVLLRSQEEIESLQPSSITARYRHPQIDRFYFAEFPFKTQGGVEHFEKHFPYERYCLDVAASDEPLRRYVSHLISLAQDNGQVPVLQFNRSLLRVGWLNRNFAPLNILLLRRPMDIWQSYLSFDGLYFPAVVSLILGQNRHKQPLRHIVEFETVPFHVTDSFENEFEYYYQFTQRNLHSLYPLFYSFYTLTCAHAARYADCTIDMNEVSANPQVRDAVTQKLYELGVEISLSDCQLPRYTALSPSDQEWLAYERVGRGLLRASLPPSLLLPACKLKEHEPLLSDYFRGVLSEFTLLTEGEKTMSDTLLALPSSDEKHRQGTLLCEQGRYDEASALLDEALGGQETAERWNDWAVVQLALGHWENAERGFRRALKVDSSFIVAATNLGVLLFDMGKLEEAIPFLTQASETATGPQCEALAKLLSQCKAWGIVPEVSESERALLDAYRQFDSALKELRQTAYGLTARFPDSRQARFFLADVLQAGGQADLALAEYQKLIRDASPNEKRRVEQAILQCQADRDYFSPDFARRVDSDEYVTGINAGAWRSYATREIQRGREIVRLVRQRIPLAGRRLLDVGCGYGGTLIAFAEQGARVVGVEVSEERARIGKKRLFDLGIQADYRLDDICEPNIELRLGTFDIIVAQDVLEHVLDPGQAIRTLSSLLRPGGVIYAQVGNKYSPDQLLADHHYGRTGITLLGRAQAIEYFLVATGLDVRHYGVGYWRTERYYRNAFARFGVQIEHAQNFASPDHVTWYAKMVSDVCRRAEQEIYPGLRPELQHRIRRRMVAVARYFAHISELIVKNGSNPELVARISDRLVKRLCLPVWRFVGTKPAQQIAGATPPPQGDSMTAGASRGTDEITSLPVTSHTSRPSPILCS